MGEREEVFGDESGLEEGREEDRGAMGGGPAGDYEDAAVEGVSGGDFEVVAFEIEAAEEVPEGGGGEAWRRAPDTLPGADAADGGVGEGGEEVREESARPEDVVVAQDGDFGGYLEDGDG